MLAYDSVRDEVVLFGGFFGSALSDTWTWDGDNWAQMSPANTPTARSGSAFTFHQALGKVILFGGLTGSGPGNCGQVLGDTWTWDGHDWASISTQVAPGARQEVRAVYDTRQHQAVLFGGTGPCSWPPYADTWVLAVTGPTTTRAQQTPPVKLGTSGSNRQDWTVVGGTTYCCGGTLGSLVQDASGTTYILSNNHVLARANSASIGENIIQRGYPDSGCAGAGTISIAKLSQFVPILFSGASNMVDAAVAETFSGQLDPTGFILGIGPVSPATVDPALNMSVLKAGRATGLTLGQVINAVGVTVSVKVGPCGQATKNAKFVNQFSISPGFAAAGDSGALVVLPGSAGSRPNPVGMVMAGSQTSIAANPISAVLQALNVTFVGSAATAAEQANAAPRPVDPRVAAALRVKGRYEDSLLSLPEVVGHGVGYSLTGSGKVVIRLFVGQATEAARRAAPTSLEGVPVEVEETGEFRAITDCASSSTAARVK